MKFSIKKGDTFARKTRFRQESDGAILKSDDLKSLFITLRSQPYENYDILLQKKLEDVTFDEECYCHFVFTSEDMERLDYGTYYFDISITLNNGYRKTVLYELEITKKTTFYNGGDISGN